MFNVLLLCCLLTTLGVVAIACGFWADRRGHARHFTMVRQIAQEFSFAPPVAMASPTTLPELRHISDVYEGVSSFDFRPVVRGKRMGLPHVW